VTFVASAHDHCDHPGREQPASQPAMLVSGVSMSVPPTPRPPTSPRPHGAAAPRPHTVHGPASARQPRTAKVDVGEPSLSSPIYFRKAIPPRRLQQRIYALVRQLSDAKTRCGGIEDAAKAAAEINLLVSHTTAAHAIVAQMRIEPQLADLLLLEPVPESFKHCLICILSQCASHRDSRERQARCATQALCTLIKQKTLPPHVLHAATLHLAALTRSVSCQRVIAADYPALKRLDEIEDSAKHIWQSHLGSAGFATITQESARYARWALRTARGRNRKPIFAQADIDEATRLAREAAIARARRIREETERYIKERSHSMTESLMQDILTKDWEALTGGGGKGDEHDAATRIQSRARGRRSRRDLEDREEARRRFEAELAARKRRILEEEEALHLFEGSEEPREDVEINVGGAVDDNVEATRGGSAALEDLAADGSANAALLRSSGEREEAEEETVSGLPTKTPPARSSGVAVVEGAFDNSGPLKPVEP
jgi:hypothetical protein